MSAKILKLSDKLNFTGYYNYIVIAKTKLFYYIRLKSKTKRSYHSENVYSVRRSVEKYRGYEYMTSQTKLYDMKSS